MTKKQRHDDAVAIIGIGCLFPKADSLEGYWANIRDGVDAITPVPESHWNPDDYFDADKSAPDKTYGRTGGFLNAVDFDPLAFGITPNNIEATDTTQLLGLVAAQQALIDAGYGDGGKEYDRKKVSVLLGVTGTLELVIPLGARLGHPLWRKALKEAGVDDATANDVVERIKDGYVPWQENSFPGLLGNVAAGRIANRLDLGGTNSVCDAACASSLSAMHLAFMELQTGKSDMVLTGGLDTFNDIFMYMCFSKTPALSPTGHARPFDAAADGTILGEGLGIIVAKRLADARRDGDRIYAVLRGIGSSSDGKGNAIYAPSSEGQSRCLQNAYDRSGVTPDTIELVEAHGTGTKAGDAAEFAALNDVYTNAACGLAHHTPKTAVGSVKSQIGHTKAAAGAAGIIKAVLALHHKVLPPTIKVDKPNEAIPQDSPLYVNTEPRPWLAAKDHPRRAAVSSFGFGGSNFHAVLEEADPRKQTIDFSGGVTLFAFSGADATDLKQQVDAIDTADLRTAAKRSRDTFDPTAPARLTFPAVGTSVPTDSITRLLTSGGGSTPDHVHYHTGPTPGKLAFIFPGQGAQYVGMLRDLAIRFPQLHDVLEAAPRDVVNRIYPIPAFTDEKKAENEAALRDTAVAQPALGATDLGALRILEHFGLKPDAVAGHSYGELVALCAAGRYDADALFALSLARGRAMAEGDGDRGAMIAVSAPVESIDAESLDLVVANHNAPNQVVLSGSTEAITAAAAHFKSQNVRATRLPVAAAFHSSFVAGAADAFAEALADVDFAPAQCDVYANASADLYPDDPAEARALLAEQLASPVRFVDQIRAMADAGAYTFVEVGPAGKLTGLISAILEDRPHVAVALDRAKTGLAELAAVLAQLAALGYPVALDRWDENYKPIPRTASAMSVKLTGANYVSPRTPRPPRPEKERPAVTESQPPQPTGDAWRSTQDGILALQKMQEQTADLHRQFLENQQQAQRNLALLIQQQQAQLTGAPIPAIPTPTPPPARGTSVPPSSSPEPTPTPEPAPSQPAAPTPEPQTPQPEIQSALLETIAEKTGYPAEMLDLDMQLEADLGIDSIKRVEIFSAMQQRLPDAPPVAPEDLGALHTLRQIVDHMQAHGSASPARGTSVPPSSPSPEPRNPAAPNTDIETALLETIAEKTGYPAEMLDLDMQLEADLGIDSIKRVEIFSAMQQRLPDAPQVAPEDLGALHTLRQIVDHMQAPGSASPARDTSVPPSSPSPEPRNPAAPPPDLARRALTTHPLRGERPMLRPAPKSEIWVTDTDPKLGPAIAQRLAARGYAVTLVTPAERDSLTVPDNLAGLFILAPDAEVDESWLLDAFKLLQYVGPKLREAGASDIALFATTTRIDGAFGLSEKKPHDPDKARRQPIAAGLAGLTKTVRHEWAGVHCKAIDFADDFDSQDKLADALVNELLTDGPIEVGLSAQGAVALDLIDDAPAGEGKPPLSVGDAVIVTGGARGVTAEVAVALAERFQPALLLLGRSPAPKDEPDWLAGLEDEAAIKAALIEHAEGDKPSPRDIDEQYRRVAAEREIRSTIERIEAAGASVMYRAVDVRDEQLLQIVIDRFRNDHGAIRGLIHGAGVLADKRIEDKTEEQFDQVVSTKVGGMLALLRCLEADDLKAIALFSSSTGRFGRKGQVDYAMANEVLNKIAQQQAKLRSSCRVVAVNWGPWDGGMVTPALRKVFEAEGVGVIPLDAGAKLLVDELCRPGGTKSPAEVVVLAEVQGAKPQAAVAPVADATMHESVSIPLSVERYGFLRSHVMDGKAVLPVAIIVEWLAHGAMKDNPGLAFAGFDDLRVLKGVVLNGQTVPLRVLAGSAEPDGHGGFVVPVELRSDEHLHVRARIVLADAPITDEPRLDPDLTDAYPHETWYGEGRLFHGQDFHAIESVEGIADSAIAGRYRAAPAPAVWIDQPLRGSWLADPLALDAAFQLMILWTFEQRGTGSLPTAIARFRVHRSLPRDGGFIVAEVTGQSDHAATADIEIVDDAGDLVARMEGYECVIDATLNDAFTRNQFETHAV